MPIYWKLKIHMIIAVVFLLNAGTSTPQPLKDRENIPHFSECYTQGLIIKDNVVWESCGLFGESHLMQWDLKTQEILKQVNFDKKYFLEGLTELNGRLYLLTWQAGVAFEIDIDTLKTLKTFKYKGQGWGLTADGKQLIMSNGSNVIQFINPQDFAVQSTIQVSINGGKPVNNLNELEWIAGKIYANVYQTDYIVVINPKTGVVENKYYLPKLLENVFRKPGVLNGIAYDKVHDNIWITGKNWPKMFKLK